MKLTYLMTMAFAMLFSLITAAPAPIYDLTALEYFKSITNTSSPNYNATLAARSTVDILPGLVDLFQNTDYATPPGSWNMLNTGFQPLICNALDTDIKFGIQSIKFGGDQTCWMHKLQKCVDTGETLKASSPGWGFTANSWSCIRWD